MRVPGIKKTNEVTTINIIQRCMGEDASFTSITIFDRRGREQQETGVIMAKSIVRRRCSGASMSGWRGHGSRGITGLLTGSILSSARGRDNGSGNSCTGKGRCSWQDKLVTNRKVR